MTQNTFCWIDIPVIDLDRAIAFYSAILNEPVQNFLNMVLSLVYYLILRTMYRGVCALWMVESHHKTVP